MQPLSSLEIKKNQIMDYFAVDPTHLDDEKKLDLNMLQEIEIYEDSTKQYSIKIKDLVEQLKHGNKEGLNKLVDLVPELLKSKTFNDYLSCSLPKPVFQLQQI